MLEMHQIELGIKNFRGMVKQNKHLVDLPRLTKLHLELLEEYYHLRRVSEAIERIGSAKKDGKPTSDADLKQLGISRQFLTGSSTQHRYSTFLPQLTETGEWKRS